MNALFAYGSLMFPEVTSIVLGRNVNDDDFLDAMLRHYRRVAIPERSYPTCIKFAGSSVKGTVILNLSEDDLKKLDAYEESFYRRMEVNVETARGSISAYAYVDSRDPLPFELTEWDRETFARDFLSNFVQGLRSRR
jgi:gamma-glutamylcyclotransferase (GGCT)/AIG2-like uncharacterized protein YtfP